MWRDPIIEGVRRAREELFKQANYDLHTLFENIRKSQKERNVKVVSGIRGNLVETSDVKKSTQCLSK